MNSLKSNMGQRMKTHRKMLHMTQEEMAERLNVSVKHYGGVERGNAGLSLENLVEVSNILGLSLDYLVKGKDSSSETIPVKLKEIYLNCPPNKRQHLIELLEMINNF